MKISLNKREILKVIFLFLIFAAIMAGLLWPTVKNISSTTSETVRLRSYLEQKYEQSILSRITKRKITNIKDQYPDLSRHIFKSGEELKLITYLESLAARNNLTQTISNSNIDRISDNKIALMLSLTGDYNNTLKYLVDLESSDYFLNIEQLQMTPVFSRNGETTNGANLYLTLGLYVNR